MSIPKVGGPTIPVWTTKGTVPTLPSFPTVEKKEMLNGYPCSYIGKSQLTGVATSNPALTVGCPGTLLHSMTDTGAPGLNPVPLMETSWPSSNPFVLLAVMVAPAAEEVAVPTGMNAGACHDARGQEHLPGHDNPLNESQSTPTSATTQAQFAEVLGSASGR